MPPLPQKGAPDLEGYQTGPGPSSRNAAARGGNSRSMMAGRRGAIRGMPGAWGRAKQYTRCVLDVQRQRVWYLRRIGDRGYISTLCEFSPVWLRDKGVAWMGGGGSNHPSCSASSFPVSRMVTMPRDSFTMPSL